MGEGKESLCINRRCIFALADPSKWQEFLVSFSEISSPPVPWDMCDRLVYAVLGVDFVFFYHVISQSSCSVFNMEYPFLVCTESPQDGMFWEWHDHL